LRLGVFGSASGQFRERLQARFEEKYLGATPLHLHPPDARDLAAIVTGFANLWSKAGPASDGTSQDDRSVADKRESVANIEAPTAERSHRATEAVAGLPPAAELYEDRLRGIWAATHEDESPPSADSEDVGAWELIREAVTRVGIPAQLGVALAAVP
jgi:hypothetical protein